MAKKLKGVVFGITNVIVEQGKLNEKLFVEISLLIKFLQSKDITPVIFGNHPWQITDKKGKRDLEEFLKENWGDIEYLNAFRDGFEAKRNASTTEQLRNRFGWDPTEVVYVGNTADDMLAAVNGKLLFLNATWFGRNTDYGFFFQTPWDIARFIDTFCLRDSLWHYAIEDGDLRFYALSIYSTLIREFEYLSSDARAVKKWGGGHPDFWTKYLLSTIYFSEVYKEVNYIALIPGHEAGSGNPIMEEPMAIFAKCFRQKLLKDLILRHTTIRASHVMRNEGLTPDHSRQLNSIKLNKFPMRTLTEAYKKSPIEKGKTVLVIDDICTNGYTLEAAKAFIQQTGANVICISWLKTINRDYHRLLRDDLKFNPFEEATFPEMQSTNYRYRSHITDRYAPEEISQKLRAYDGWQWPANVKP